VYFVVVNHMGILTASITYVRVVDIPAVFSVLHRRFAQALQAPPIGLGLAGMMALFVRAYALGGGTYTGIEAVSNGLSIMREPKVQTGKRTMALMAVSLAVTTGRPIFACSLVTAPPASRRALNPRPA